MVPYEPLSPFVPDRWITVSDLHVATGVMAALVLAMSLFAGRLRRSLLAEPMIALFAGVAIGPVGLGWLSFDGDHGVLEQAARFTLALMVVSVGLGLPRRYSRTRWRSLTVLTVGSMLLTWGASSLLVLWILDLDLLTALLIGAVLTPLDPVLAAGVAVGEVPERELPGEVRHLLSFESAASHGLGYVLVLLPAYLITHAPGEAWGLWVVRSVLWDGVAAVAIGALIGAAAGMAHRWSLRRTFTEGDALTATLVALALSVVALLQLMGSSGLLAVFVAGASYARTRTRQASEEVRDDRLRYETTFKQILQVPVFVLLGVALPWGAWSQMGWAAVTLIIAVLLLRRIPALLILRPFVPLLRGWDATLFVGWFGSVGVGAIHFALIAEKHTHLSEAWAVASLVIAASVVSHDATVRPLTRWLHRRVTASPRS